MEIKKFIDPSIFPRHNDFPEYSSNEDQSKLKGRSPIELQDIRDTDTDSHVQDQKNSPRLTKSQVENFWPQLTNKQMDNSSMKNMQQTDMPQIDAADIDGPNPSSNASPNTQTLNTQTANTQTANTQTLNTQTANTQTSGDYAKNLQAASANTHVNLKPVIRGDEAKLDAQVHDQASFGKLVDQVAKEYGLDPNQFRAQLQAESAAFSNGYKQAMQHNGDVDRGANASLGLGQISGNFLNGGSWANALTNTPELGNQNISTQQYMNSVTTQLRMAAASDALRIDRVGSLDGALRQYVSGHSNADSQNQIYIDNINKFMQDEEMMNIGR